MANTWFVNASAAPSGNGTTNATVDPGDQTHAYDSLSAAVNAKEGDLFSLNCFIDKESWPLKIKFMGKETVKSEVGKIRCLKFRPVVQKGRIFKKEEDVTILISDDKNHILVRAQAKILIGTVKMDLTGYKNLNNPLAKD